MSHHNKEMTTETKQMILRLKQEGYAHRKIAEIIRRDHSTITKFLKRYDERNSVENKPKTRRKRLVTERGDRVILRSVKVNRRETLRDLTNIVNEREKRENELNCLNWPSQSPDLNIIENVWRTIKIKLQNSKCDILNKQILVREVKKIWIGLHVL
jgi:transposase